MDELQAIEQDSPDKTMERLSPRLRQWIAPVWFLSGIVVGVVGLAIFITLTTPRPRLDAATLREAARDGTLDAIATVQAGGPLNESRNPDPPTTGKTFAGREANRVGNKSAKVTIVEFSDFQ